MNLMNLPRRIREIVVQPLNVTVIEPVHTPGASAWWEQSKQFYSPKFGGLLSAFITSIKQPVQLSSDA